MGLADRAFDAVARSIGELLEGSLQIQFEAVIAECLRMAREVYWLVNRFEADCTILAMKGLKTHQSIIILTRLPWAYKCRQTYSEC